MFAKILIADRGELAVRIVRTLREMEIASVAIFSQEDRRALHVQWADEAICIDEYANGALIIAAALSVGAEAIHPGCRALSGDADFARQCTAAGLKFIGGFGTNALPFSASSSPARRIQVTVLGDQWGNLVHFGDREIYGAPDSCLVAEAPSPFLTTKPEVRAKLCHDALEIARNFELIGAATFEFLVNAGGEYRLIRTDPHLGRHHGVTEQVYGADLVYWQVVIAAGERLGPNQATVHFSGAAIECLVSAKSTTGRIALYLEPSGPGVRVDSAAFNGWSPVPGYAPVLANLAVWAESRAGAIRRMRRALEEYRVLGIATNMDLYRRIMNNDAFILGNFHECNSDEYAAAQAEPLPQTPELIASVIAAAHVAGQAAPPLAANQAEPASAWRSRALLGLFR